MSGCFLLFLVLMAASFSNIYEAMYGVPLLFKIALALPLIGALLAIGVLVFAVVAWAKKYWYGCRRLTYTLILAAGVVFIWLLHFYNLLGWHL
jgi:hypothetical protein